MVIDPWKNGDLWGCNYGKFSNKPQPIVDVHSWICHQLGWIWRAAWWMITSWYGLFWSFHSATRHLYSGEDERSWYFVFSRKITKSKYLRWRWWERGREKYLNTIQQTHITKYPKYTYYILNHIPDLQTDPNKQEIPEVTQAWAPKMVIPTQK